MGSERDLSTIPQCLEWYKLVLRVRLPTPAVRYLVHIGLLPCAESTHLVLVGNIVGRSVGRYSITVG